MNSCGFWSAMMRRWHGWEGSAKDFVYAVRSWRKGGGAAITAVVTLALALGVTTALFSVVKAVLITRLPFKEQNRVAVLWETPPHTRSRSLTLPANFVSWKASSKTFSELAAIRRRTVVLTWAGDAVELHTESVSPNLFQLLGVQTILGRGFLPQNGAPGNEHVAVLSEKLWRDRFGGNPGVLGKTVVLDGRSYEIVGVLPALDVWLGNQPELWTPLTPSMLDNIPLRQLVVVGQLNPGTSFSTAQAEFTALAHQLEQSRPEWDKGWGVSVVPLTEQIVGDVRLPLVVLFSSCVLVLLIACANVANICLMRVVVHGKEIAVRCALGASRWRVMRQTLFEALVLSVAASTLGVAIAFALLRLFIRWAPTDIPRIGETSLDSFAVGFNVLLTLVTGISVGLLPSFRASRVNVSESLKVREGTPSVAKLRTSEWFIVAQVALAVSLLAGSAVLLNGLSRIQNRSLGFDPGSVLTMKINLPHSQSRSQAWQTNFYHSVIREVEAVPGVNSAALTVALPTVEPSLSKEDGIAIVGHPNTTGQKSTSALQVVDGDYFKTMSIHIVRGRSFSPVELTEDRSVAIVNESFARQFLPGLNAVGQRYFEGGGNTGPTTEIIGVAADVAPADFAASSTPLIYTPLVQLPVPFMTLVVRISSEDPLSMAHVCIDRIHMLEPSQPVADVMSMDEALAARVSRPRFNTLLLGMFSLVAFVFALAGIYSLVAYHVSQSTRAIGIYLALGASRQQIIVSMLKRNLSPVVYGLAAGAVLALISAKLLSSVIVVGVAYPLAIVIIVFLLFFLVAILAICMPLMQTLNVDPMLALRAE